MLLLRRDEIISVKSTLGKGKKKPQRSKRQKNEFTMDDDSAAKKLKTALIILPIIMILLAITGLIIGLNQFSGLFAPAQTQSSVQSDAEVYDDSKLLLIVSPDSPLPGDYALNLDSFGGIQVDKMIIPDLQAMLDAAKKEGMALSCDVGYISPEQQHEVYMDEVQRLIAQNGYSNSRALEEAENTVPAENHSELQTGLCVRFSSLRSGSFKGSEEYYWLMSNSIRYGFILRYPEGKESSTGFDEDDSLFRYVGMQNASHMRSMDMCLDEYVRYLNSR